jgi:Tfp pilus assembly protein PilF
LGMRIDHHRHIAFGGRERDELSMNRRDRRAALKRGKDLASASTARQHAAAAGIDDLLATAWRHYRQGQFAQAEEVCRHVLARDPAHVDTLNLLGLMSQASGQHGSAVKLFAKALVRDDGNAACHFNIATSYPA